MARKSPIHGTSKGEGMQVTKTSKLTGKEHTQEIDITQEQWDRWKGGELIQNVCPHLSDDDREFLISGATKEEWAAAFNQTWGSGCIEKSVPDSDD